MESTSEIAKVTVEENDEQQQLRLPERSSTEIVHALFGPAVGLCWGDFVCNFHRQRGRLYASSNAILFFSNLFGFERRLCLQFGEMTRITSYRTTSLCMTTVHGSDVIFKSFSDRDLVLKLLTQLMIKFTGDIPPSDQQNRQYVAMDSDSDNDNEPDTAEVENVALHRPLETLTLSLSTLSMASSSSPTMEETQIQTIPVDHPDSESDHSSVGSPENTLAAWDDMKNSNDPPYKDTALEGLTLPCTLDEFFGLFLADNAPHSIVQFQKDHVGDSELDVTPWLADSESDDIFRRSIRFRHPIPNSLGVGPSSALAERKQCLRRFGVHGLCLQTSIYVKGLPVSDAFYVDDKWILEASGYTSVTLTVRHHTRFTKMTFLKRLIQNTTKSEVKEWYDGYSKMLLAALQKDEMAGGHGTDRTEREVAVKDLLPESKALGSWSAELTRAVWISALFVSVLLILLSILGFSLNSKLLTLQHEIHHLRNEHVNMIIQLQKVIDDATVCRNINIP